MSFKQNEALISRFPILALVETGFNKMQHGLFWRGEWENGLLTSVIMSVEGYNIFICSLC